MIPTTERLDQGLIVSVQAPQGSPMRDSQVIAGIAEASLRCGAVGVRLESPEHIGAVRRRCPDALIYRAVEMHFSRQLCLHHTGMERGSSGVVRWR